MKRNWTEQELALQWSLFDEERELLRTKTPTRRLGMAALQQFLKLEGRFPREHGEIPAAALRYLAQQLAVSPTLFADYNLDDRTAKPKRGG